MSGQPFAAFADTNIFKPLGMTHTHFHDDVTRIVPNRATGYSRAANGFRVATRTYTDTLVGNAGLFTTVGDLLRWERNFAKPQVGGPALIAEMQTPTIASRWSATNHYGLGLEIAQHRGMRTVGHGGADQGRRAYVVRYPDRDLSIAVLCNLDDIDPTVLTKRVAEIVLDGQFPEPADNTTDQSAVDRHVSLSPQQLEAKVGLYRNISDESVGRVFLRDGRLMA